MSKCICILQMDNKEKELMEGLEQESLVKAVLQLADQKIQAAEVLEQELR